jgi:hypothetical protein
MPTNRPIHLFCTLLVVSTIMMPAYVVADSVQLQASRQQLYKALAGHKVFDPDRQIAHIAHVCSLRVDGGWYPVVDLGEMVKGAVVPRGVNTIIVLDPTLRPLQKIDYATERPLFCLENKLFVFGDLTIDGVAGTGSVLEFSEKGKKITLRQIDANDRSIPPTGKRTMPVQ